MMAVGFQCFNDSGAFQVDGTYPQYALARKVSVSTNVLVTANGSDNTYSKGTFSLSGSEIAALYCTSPVALLSVSGGTATFISTAGVGTTADIYVFSQVSSSGSNSGFQVFNASGTLVFDAMQKPLAMVGFPSGEGTFTYNSSRKYAVLCCNQYLKIESTGWNFGGFYRNKITRGFITSVTGGATISNILYFDDYYQMDPNQGGVDQTVPGNIANKHIIVDVTYY
jgi:hypothetical protein